MWIYIILLILAIVSSILYSNRLNNFDKLIFLILAVVAGFRYEVGTDYNEYVRYFYSVESKGYSPGEIGFDFIALIISSIGLSSQLLLFTLSSLTMFFLYKGTSYYFERLVIYKPVFYIMMFIFVYFHSLNVVRQMLAAMIIFYASKFIIERCLKKFIFWVLLASLFHFSSLVFLPLYFLVNKNYKKVVLITVIIGSFLLSYSNIVLFITEQIATNYTFLDIGGYFANYVNSSFNERSVSYGIVFFVNLILLIFLIIIKDKFSNNKYYLMLFNFYYLNIVFLILAGDSFVFARFQYYFSIYMVICIASILMLFDKSSRKILKVILLLMYTVLYLYIVISGYINVDSTDIIPYQFELKIFK